MARPSKYPEHRDRILTLVNNAAARHSRPPSMRTIAQDLGVGVATVHSYLARLASEGLIETPANRHRAVVLTQQGFQHLQRPAE